MARRNQGSSGGDSADEYFLMTEKREEKQGHSLIYIFLFRRIGSCVRVNALDALKFQMSRADQIPKIDFEALRRSVSIHKLNLVRPLLHDSSYN